MIALLEPNVNTPDDEEVLLGLAPAPPKLLEEFLATSEFGELDEFVASKATGKL